MTSSSAMLFGLLLCMVLVLAIEGKKKDKSGGNTCIVQNGDDQWWFIKTCPVKECKRCFTGTNCDGGREWRGYITEDEWKALKKVKGLDAEGKDGHADNVVACSFIPGLMGKNCKKCKFCEYRIKGDKGEGVDECNGAAKHWIMPSMLVISFIATIMAIILVPISI